MKLCKYLLITLLAIATPAPAGWLPLVKSGGGGGPTQVRVTFTQIPTVGPITINNASVGIQAGSGDPYDTSATPVELKFAGVSGFTLAAGNSITSDWATLTVSSSTGSVFSATPDAAESGWNGYTMRAIYPVTGSATPVVVIMDVGSGGAISYKEGGPAGVAMYYLAATTSYATADVTGYNGPYGTNRVQAVTLIETQ